MKKVWAKGYIFMVTLICSALSVPIAAALQSTNFQFNETSLGGIGLSKQNSSNFQAQTSGGVIGFGNSAATNTQINAGHTTTNDPALAFSVSTPPGFGSFSPGTTSTTTSTFTVSDYTSYGYIVQILGTAPTNGTHTIAPMAATGVSTAGSEQFGINLVANTSPSSIGANPNHGQFGFGNADANYGTSNNYRYVSGETIASGPKSGGVTTYTISYIVNVDNLTIGGQYTSNQEILCTATF